MNEDIRALIDYRMEEARDALEIVPISQVTSFKTST
jgi:hypothetical protein